MADGGTKGTSKVEELSKDSNARPDSLELYQRKLKSAVGEGDTSRVSELIQAGADVNATSSYDDKTPLFIAVQNNNQAMVRILIDAGADVNSMMFDAVYYNNESMVRLLIEAGADVNIVNNHWYGPRYVLDHSVQNDNKRKDMYGSTPLFAAVQRDNEGIVQVLIDADADVNVTDNEGKTALFYAVQQNNNESVVRVLIGAGADVNIANKTGKTALFYAVEQSNNEIVRALMKAGANVNCTDNAGMTPLFHTVSCTAGKNALVVCETLIEAGADVNIADKTGKTALFHAVRYRNLGLISALIRAGIDVNIVDCRKQTALFKITTDVTYFLRLGDKTKILAQLEEGEDFIEAGNSFSYYGAHTAFNIIFQALLDAGADINSTTVNGETALSKAVECGDFRSVCALVKAGADLEIKNIWGRTALFGALPWCYSGDFCFLDALIEAGADVNTQDNQGETPLFEAVRYQPFDFSVVQKLIDAGADTNKTDNNKRTALFHFVTKTCPENEYSDFSHMIGGLLKAGLDVNKVDKDGKTVLHWAAKGDDVEMTNKLIEAGADTNIPDNQGQTALFVTVMPQFIVPRENEEDVSMFVGIPGETEKRKIARALVEDGNADVNARDTLGRTPLFYACEKSLPITTYLIENGANLLIRDNCGVDVLSCFIENCVVNQFENRRLHPSLTCDMNEVLNLFLQHGITRNAVFEAIVNVVFCKTLLVASYVCSDPRNKIKSLFDILKFAREYITETHNAKKEIIDKILTLVQEEPRDFQTFYDFLVPDILSQLFELGANPNSVDSHGNTALHFATCLPLYGLTRETVMKICHQLDKFGVIFNVRNHERETPLQFCLSPAHHPEHCWKDNRVSKLRNLRDVFLFLLQHGSCAEEATSSGNSVFHLLLELFQELCKGGASEQDKQEEEEKVQILLSFFDKKLYVDKETVNKRKNIKLDAPLHIWATSRVNGKFDEDAQKTILNHLLEYGANLSISNEDGRTPLHVCSSWTAVTLLLDAGADPCVFDSLGRPPLLVAAESVQQLPHFLEGNRLYFDVLVEPQEFWRSAIKKGLDPWTVDKRGESVLSILIKSDQFVLSQALVEVARFDKHLQSETIAASLLNTICKDKSTRAHWKSNLVEMILKSVSGSIVRGQNNETLPLHLCCLSIVENLSGYQVLEENKDKEVVYWTIAKQLLRYGADGKSCLDIAKTNPALKDLLTKPQDIKDVPLLIPWTAISKTFEDRLAKVARRLESRYFKPYWCHKDPIASGSFGAVFAGINEKDCREVAIKRIEKIRMQRAEDKREITNLTALADCEHVVRYLSFFEDENFCYVVLELTEGNLDDYLDGSYFDRDQRVDLCGNVISGLRYLHRKKILHRDLKPGNILYKCHPKLCLKIADFGLSRRIDSAYTTVYGTNVGTRCWIAPEVLRSTKAGEQHSKESDIFSCGLVLHYVLSVRGKAHPFAPANLTNKSEVQINHETEANILNGKMEGWDDSLCPKAADLVKAMLDGDGSKRPSAKEAKVHPLFWSRTKKVHLLIAVGNQPEFKCPRAKRTLPLTAVETDLEASFGTIVKYANWNDLHHVHMPAIYTKMTRKKRKAYVTHSVVELVRFVRNSYAHATALPKAIQYQLLKDYVFLEYFPNLVMGVYKAVTTHGWDQTRKEIESVIKE